MGQRLLCFPPQLHGAACSAFCNTAALGFASRFQLVYPMTKCRFGFFTFSGRAFPAWIRCPQLGLPAAGTGLWAHSARPDKSLCKTGTLAALPAKLTAGSCFLRRALFFAFCRYSLPLIFAAFVFYFAFLCSTVRSRFGISFLRQLTCRLSKPPDKLFIYR